MIDIAVLQQTEWETRQAKIVEDLNLPVVQSCEDAMFILQRDDQGRLTIQTSSIKGKAVFSDAQPLFAAQGKDPLMKAIGYQTKSVFDATAGWATDAIHIASHKIRIMTCERNPVVYALVADGLKRCSHPVIREMLTLKFGNSLDLLEQLQPAPEVVYLDPMYPQKSGSAAPKKNLQMLQRLYQLDRYADIDSANSELMLVEKARGVAKRRVVVKRPHSAPPISPNPSGAIVGKLVRFDIYSPS